MNQNFANHSTGRFAFSVSQAQLRVLFAFDQGFNYMDESHWIKIHAGLLRKGLIASRPYTGLAKKRGVLTHWIRDVENMSISEITDAGRLIVKLAKEAGINYEYKPSKSYGDETFISKTGELVG